MQAALPRPQGRVALEVDWRVGGFRRGRGGLLCFWPAFAALTHCRVLCPVLTRSPTLGTVLALHFHGGRGGLDDCTVYQLTHVRV